MQRKTKLVTCYGKDYTYLADGKSLRENSVRKLESRIQKGAAGKADRLRLLGHYRLSVAERVPHILWLIDHEPKNRCWRSPELSLDGRRFQVEFLEARCMWLEQVSKWSSNANVLGNAGLFLVGADFALGKELLIKASSIALKDDFWPGELSRLCFMVAECESGARRDELLTEALDYSERFLSLYGEDRGRKRSGLRLRALQLSAKVAQEIGNLELAELRLSQLSELGDD